MRSSIVIVLIAIAQWCFGQNNGSTLSYSTASSQIDSAVQQIVGSYSTASGQLDSAVQQIAASIFPSSIQPQLAVALASASVSGDPRVLVSSLITAAAPPPFITESALGPYTSRLQKAESLISSLQAAVNNAMHPTPNSTIGGNATIAITSTETAANGSAFVTTISAQVVNGSTITSSATAGTTASATSQSASTAGGKSSTSPSKGFAVPTEIPVAAAGVIGLLGALAAL